MEVCPNCRRVSLIGTRVCDCGEPLVDDGVSQPQWETETVFHPPQTDKRPMAATLIVAAAVATIMLGLAWPQIRERLTAPGASNSQTENSTAMNQPAAQSDIIPADDLVPPGGETSNENPEGVFVFSPDENIAIKKGDLIQNDRTKAAPASLVTTAVAGTNPYDAQLLTDQSDTHVAKNQKVDKDLPDCKPTITTTLKLPDLPPAPPAKTIDDAKTYILGPRGGCFYVTAGGSKRYVGRGLCSSAAAVGGRQ